LNALGIVAALTVESRPLRPAVLGDGTLLIVSGVGTAAARDGARRLAAAGARALISWGMAGALDPALAAGTLVLASEVVAADGGRFLTARHWREQLAQQVAARHPICSGRILTSPEPIRSAADKALTFRRTAAAAVDMESAAVAEVAAAERLDFLVVRAIVDTARDTLPQAALSAAAAGTRALRLAQMLGSLARSPGEVPELIRLASRYRIASRALAAVARSGALVPEATGRAANGTPS
jgi:adenosylhomocysteine nucleosidase